MTYDGFIPGEAFSISIGTDLFADLFVTAPEEPDPDCGLGKEDRVWSPIDCATDQVLCSGVSVSVTPCTSSPSVSESEPGFLAPLSFL